ncbi:AAA family ATPase, partial [Mycolicibacter arupensis]|uniref:AAA family ATPase n=1 Tax=Mycolicibacter arupensis TaxID=342002 RepID=UPI003B3A2AEC
MRLHRLVLTNYRGVAHREIDFPDHGVVVVSGANEIGKSSMIEALDLLLEAKDRSAKKDVKQVKPTYADVGAEVTAEISTGPYRFVYHKRFHKAPRTQLTISEPRREQLTGDEAHERVRAMLDETMDTGLWQAQRVLQASSTAAVDLSGCDALSRALDVAAGDTGTLSGTEPVLIERIDAEYGRYFTGTGLSYRQMYYMPIAYLPDYHAVADGERSDKEYDVLFYGDLNNARRREFIDQIQRKYRVKLIGNLFGEALYRELRKAKVVINVHYYEGALLETTRLYECLSL